MPSRFLISRMRSSVPSVNILEIELNSQIKPKNFSINLKASKIDFLFQQSIIIQVGQRLYSCKFRLLKSQIKFGLTVKLQVVTQTGMKQIELKVFGQTE